MPRRPAAARRRRPAADPGPDSVLDDRRRSPSPCTPPPASGGGVQAYDYRDIGRWSTGHPREDLRWVAPMKVVRKSNRPPARGPSSLRPFRERTLRIAPGRGAACRASEVVGRALTSPFADNEQWRQPQLPTPRDTGWRPRCPQLLPHGVACPASIPRDAARRVPSGRGTARCAFQVGAPLAASPPVGALLAAPFRSAARGRNRPCAGLARACERRLRPRLSRPVDQRPILCPATAGACWTSEVRPRSSGAAWR